MADLTYQPLVYMKQGSTELIVASSGLITVESGGEVTVESGGNLDVESGGEISIESGGTMDVESGGGIDIESGGDITVETGGHIIWPVEGATSSACGSSTLSALAATGVTYICSSGDKRILYLAAPRAGDQKYIVVSDGSTGAAIYIDTQTAGATMISSTGAFSTMGLAVWDGTTNDAPPAYLHLVGISATKWLVADYMPSSGWVFASTSS